MALEVSASPASTHFAFCKTLRAFPEHLQSCHVAAAVDYKIFGGKKNRTSALEGKALLRWKRYNNKGKPFPAFHCQHEPHKAMVTVGSHEVQTRVKFNIFLLGFAFSLEATECKCPL